jgi:hypothetical protein
MKNPPIVFRQGDVCLVKISGLPQAAARAEPREDGKVILAWGEATGHHHRVETRPEAPSARLWSADAERFLQVMGRAELVHEEHSAITLDPGVYQVAIQTEYHPQEPRRVAD